MRDITAPSLTLVSEDAQQLTKGDLESCLETMYTKLAAKFQSELHKSTNVLSQEIATLGSRTDCLETKHDELSLAYGDLSREHDHLQTAFLQLQAQVEDLDNRNRRNNLRVRGIPESVSDLSQTVTKLFKSLLPDRSPGSFACDRIHRALRPKPPSDKPPRDIVLCLKDFLTKEDILRAARNTPTISFEGSVLQIFPDVSPATLEKRRKMKEVTTALFSARIHYKWGFPFKLIVPHNGSTYIATSLPEGREILTKLGLADAPSPRRPPLHLVSLLSGTLHLHGGKG
ncbi:unnamed protein product, partial [Staurois parvus]